jgi:hypothetical protein
MITAVMTLALETGCKRTGLAPSRTEDHVERPHAQGDGS